MKTIPVGMQALLDTGATTLCTCWRIERLDGTVFGFTNHDRALTFNATTYKPETGFMPSETASSLGLQVDTSEVEGALSSAEITDADIALGKWDNAACEIWRVDWGNVANRVILRKGSIGEVTRGSQAFAAEIRGLAHVLGQAKGRTFQRTCDAVLGDMRCGINLNLAIYKGTGAVSSDVDDRLLTVTGIDAFAEGWFAQGLLTWTGGANAGAKCEVAGHRFTETGSVVIELWRRAERPVAATDTFTITAGCGKTWDICRDKFANGDNFRGFPHMPGNDAGYQVAKKAGPNDGGSFFK
jgi:uncharacterized phage protein (TIGR02218 family)